jgi:hypothetical protein
MARKKTYVSACLAVALAYALLTGRQSLPCRLADGIVYGTALFLAGIMLWNVFRYAVPAGGRSFYRLVFLVMLAILTVGFVVGVESLSMFLCFPSLFGDFAATIPLRIFITLLLYVIARLYYVSCAARPEPEVFPAGRPPAHVPVERITVRNGLKIKIISLEEILYLQADGDYVAIHTAEGRWLKELTMKYMEDALPPDRFIRVHRSYIVNIMRINRIERYGERQQVILHHGEKIKISATGYRALKQRLGI